MSTLGVIAEQVKDLVVPIFWRPDAKKNRIQASSEIVDYIKWLSTEPNDTEVWERISKHAPHWWHNGVFSPVIASDMKRDLHVIAPGSTANKCRREAARKDILWILKDEYDALSPDPVSRGINDLRRLKWTFKWRRNYREQRYGN